MKGTDTSKQNATQPEKIDTFHSQGFKSRIEKLQRVDFEDEVYIVAARTNGTIELYKDDGSFTVVNSVADLFEKDEFVSVFVSAGYLYAATGNGVVIAVKLADFVSGKTTTPITVNITSPVSAFIPHPTQAGVFASGGKENDVAIIRLFKKKITEADLKEEILFKAKNVKPDKLDLRVPIWISNIAFVDLDQHKKDRWFFITTTRYGQVRKYDTSHGRKPIYSKKLSDTPLVTLKLTADDKIICSDTKTTTGIFDINKGVLLGKFKGATGATQSIDTVDGKLAAGSLDRYVRVFDIDTREQLAKVFIGTKISSVVLLDSEDPLTEEEVKEIELKESKARAIEDEEEDDEELWKTLDKMNPKKKRKL